MEIAKEDIQRDPFVKRSSIAALRFEKLKKNILFRVLNKQIVLEIFKFL